MVIVRQSTARTFMIGPVLDADGVAVTDGVIGDFKLSKNGAAPAAFNGSATLTHRHTGHYSLAATSSDLDTVGSAEVTIDDTVNACVVKSLTVIEEAAYDALFAASAPGYVVDQPVNAAKVGGTTQTGRDLGASVLLSSGTGTGQISLSSGAVLLQATQTGVTIPTVTTLTNAPSDPAGVSTLLTRVGTPSNLGGGATVAANLADIEGQTDDIGAAGAGLTALASAANLATLTGYVAALAVTTGTVTTDGGNSATSFETSLSQTTTDYWKDAWLLLTSGAMSGQIKRITAYNGSTKIITVAGGFTGTPADGVSFAIVNR